MSGVDLLYGCQNQLHGRQNSPVKPQLQLECAINIGTGLAIWRSTVSFLLGYA